MTNSTKDYLIQDVLYEGKISTVFKGQRKSDLTPVILKLLRLELANDERIEKFENEYDLLKKIESPYIITPYDIFHYENSVMLVLEEFSPMTLASYIDWQQLDLKTELEIAIQIVTGIGEIHKHNIIHNRINPKNILIDTNNKIKIIDFYNASAEGKELPKKSIVEEEEMIRLYTSPEKLGKIFHTIDHRSDIYSIGITLFELFTRKLPFQEKNLDENFEEPPHAHHIRMEVSHALSDIIRKCMEYDPEKRYKSAFGLKRDLETCLLYLKEKTSIPYFLSGEYDFYTRFHPPEKIFGRENELKTIKNCIDQTVNGKQTILTIVGAPGIGKTSLVSNIKKNILKQSGIFLLVRFDQFNKNIPYYGIKEIFQEFIRNLNPKEKEEFKVKIQKNISINGQIISDFLPELKTFIEEQPHLEKLQPYENENRFKYVLKQFFKLIITNDKPVFIAFENAHSSDQSTLDFLNYCFNDSSISHLMVIFTYINEEINPLHSLKILLNNASETSKETHHVHLQTLGFQEIRQLTCEIFNGLSDESLDVLIPIIMDVSKGNPFYAVQLLKFLFEKEIISYQTANMTWLLDFEELDEIEFHLDLDEFFKHKLNKIDRNLLEILQIASLVGFDFTLNKIKVITDTNIYNLIKTLNIGIENELISVNLKKSESEDDLHFQFTHDIIQKSFYYSMDETYRNQLHVKIGKKLLNSSDLNSNSVSFIEIANHLNQSFKLLKTRELKSDLLKINFLAGKEIEKVQAYHEAIPYFQIASEFLVENDWKDNYELAISTHEKLAICLKIIGNHEDSQKIFDLCLTRSKTNDEKINLYETMIHLFGRFKDFNNVFLYTNKALSLLDYPINMNPSVLSVAFKIFEVRGRLLLFKDKDILRLPVISNDRINKILTIINSLTLNAFLSGRNRLWLSANLSLVKLTLKHGLSENTGFIGYAILLASRYFQNYEEAFRYGELSQLLNSHFPITSNSCLSQFCYIYFIHFWKHPLKESIALNEKLYSECMMHGAIPIATIALVTNTRIKLLIGNKIQDTLKSINESINLFKSLSATYKINTLYVHREVCRALLNQKEDPTDCSSSEIPEDFKGLHEINLDTIHQLDYSMWRVILLYLFEHFNDANELACRLSTSQEKYPYLISWHFVNLCQGLSLGALIKNTSSSNNEWKQLKSIYKNFCKLEKASPQNFSIHKKYLEAEIERLLENTEKSIKIFNEGIAKAISDDNFLFIALGYELLSRLYILLQRKELASHFIAKSAYFYDLWGSTAKVEDLKRKYVDYFAFIETGFNTTKLPTATIAPEAFQTLGSISATFTSIHEATFDLNTFIQSSQSITGELLIDELMETVLTYMIENAGANKSFLVLNTNSQLLIYSEAYLNKSYSPLKNPIPLEARQNDFSISIVEYVARTKSEVGLRNATEEGPFTEDYYIRSKEAKSIICLPLISDEILVGVLYLENTSNEGAFTPRHFRLLSMLTEQISIAIKNALFYQSIQTQVHTTTSELSEKNIELQRAFRHIENVQDQLIQQEKLASLGVLTAGIAHELKNPLNFIINFSQIARDNLNYLKEEIDSGNKEEQKNLVEELKENLTVIDQNGTRSHNIIKGMLSHAHQGSKELEKIDINALLEQAFGLAYYTFRKREPTFNLKINKELDKTIDQVQVYPGDLIRVIINIIDNACYAMFEKMKREGKEYSPVFLIKTFKEDDFVVIILKDNGPGIPQEYLDKVFQPFFTTKPAGSGTGLGLSIARDIIVKEHKGVMEVTSEPNTMTEFVIKLPFSLKGQQIKPV